MSDASTGPDDQNGGHGGRILLLAVGAGLAGLMVLRRRSKKKAKRKQRDREARLRARGVDVEKVKALHKGLDRASTSAALSQRRLRKSLTGD